MILVSEYVSEETILPELGATSPEEAFRQIVAQLARLGAVRDGKGLFEALCEREAIMTTGLGGGIAIPHAWTPDVTRVVIVLGRAPGGMEWRALDGRPVNLMFLLATPEDDPWRHLQMLARISRLARSKELRSRLTHAASAREMLEAVAQSDRAAS